MGLDMFLVMKTFQERHTYSQDDEGNLKQKINPEYVQLIKKITLGDLEDGHTHGIEIAMNVMYWRKANAIHRWFVDKLNNGEDDCRPIWVGREQLLALLDTCEDVFNAHTEEKAMELLPPGEGFFFGSTNIDDWYWSDLEYTIKRLKVILDKTEDKLVQFEYQASW